MIVQPYIAHPLLIDGFKFDLRVYVLVLCVDPLRVLVYKEGLVRLCTVPYAAPTAANKDCSYMHITNYAINKTNPAFRQNNNNNNNTNTNTRESNTSTSTAADFIGGYGVNAGDDDDDCPDAEAEVEAEVDIDIDREAIGEGEAGSETAAETEEGCSKRSLSWLWVWLATQGRERDAIWSSICDIVVKTLISAQAGVAEALRLFKTDPENCNPFTCFEVFCVLCLACW